MSRIWIRWTRDHPEWTKRMETFLQEKHEDLLSAICDNVDREKPRREERRLVKWLLDQIEGIQFNKWKDPDLSLEETMICWNQARELQDELRKKAGVS